MKGAMRVIGALGLGAGLMYYYDPTAGKRRRARVRDAVNGKLHAAGDFIDAAQRDLKNRARGYFAEALNTIHSEPVPDEILVERIRAALGRIVTHPHSIHVTCGGGQVTVSGPILSREVDRLIDTLWTVRGVTEVINRLESHVTAGDNPGLQGASLRPGRQPEYLQSNWSPGPRLLACIAGGGMAAYGFNRAGIRGLLYQLTGLSLLARATTNLELKRIFGTVASGKTVTVQKTINIDARPETVFQFWTNLENFPKFMRHILEVTDLGDGKSHWVMEGPAGTRLQWEAMITESIPNQEIRWKTLNTGDNQIAHAGTVHFRVNSKGGTQVHIQLEYNPPGGALGHALAHMFGADPKSEMDDDLVRMKTMIETGKPPHDAAVRMKGETALSA